MVCRTLRLRMEGGGAITQNPEKVCSRNKILEGLTLRKLGLFEESKGGLVWPERQ